MKIITVPDGVKKQLTIEFKCEYATVNRALELKSQTKKANAIRKRAFELGGKIVEVEQVKPNN